jgi:hypothetical protein
MACVGPAAGPDVRTANVPAGKEDAGSASIWLVPSALAPDPLSQGVTDPGHTPGGGVAGPVALLTLAGPRSRGTRFAGLRQPADPTWARTLWAGESWHPSA